jgi:hypothetical protein
MTAAHTPDAIGIVTRRLFTDNGCEVISIVVDPADAQQTLYGTVTRDGMLIGSYYCADRVGQRDWRIVTHDGHHLTVDGEEVRPRSHPAAVWVLTRILTAPEHEIDTLLHDALRPPTRTKVSGEPCCPSCEVAIGHPHVEDCDVARCLVTGLQRLSCEHEHNCGNDTWSGRWPGETDCERLGWMIGPGLPDINRLLAEATWNPATQQWEIRV